MRREMFAKDYSHGWSGQGEAVCEQLRDEDEASRKDPSGGVDETEQVLHAIRWQSIRRLLFVERLAELLAEGTRGSW